jgi:hypothetical protein
MDGEMFAEGGSDPGAGNGLEDPEGLEAKETAAEAATKYQHESTPIRLDSEH